jgi:ABC-type polysaccharide/polyol phosphate export permease
MALTKAIWGMQGVRARLLRLLEDAVTACLLLFALSRWAHTRGMPYAVFLLCGLAPWFYIKEIYTDSPALPMLFGPLLVANKRNVAWLGFCKAVTALPTLLFWRAAAALCAMLMGYGVAGLYLLPYFLLCTLINGAAQSLLASAFSPLAPSTLTKGLAITLPILFWTTPIVWPAYAFSNAMRLFARLNPLYYLCESLRTMLTAGTLPDWRHTLAFFIVSAAMGVLGYIATARVWGGARAAAPAPNERE